jgi:hypothetical protein
MRYIERLRQALGGVRHVHGVIAHALEIVRNLVRGHDLTEVRRHGLLQREQLEHLLVDLDLELVDAVVRAHDPVGHRRVAGEHGRDRLADDPLHEPGHLQEIFLEGVELVVEAPPRWMLVFHRNPSMSNSVIRTCL